MIGTLLSVVLLYTTFQGAWFHAGLSAALLQRMHRVNDIAGKVAVLLWQIGAACNNLVWNAEQMVLATVDRTARTNWQQWKEAALLCTRAGPAVQNRNSSTNNTPRKEGLIEATIA